ncbi:MAG: SMP-30/gluconolactonase/LRE family protein [Solirubrobacteraceae bacterium]
MDEPKILKDGIAFGESPRWHENRLWFCDWAAEELIAVDMDGTSELIAEVHSFPFCIDWLPDGTLLIVSAREQRVLRMETDGSLVMHADLSRLSNRPPNNEIVVDGRGHVYVNGGGFDMMAGEEFAPGTVALIGSDGAAREVADGIAFANGMAVTPDNATLIVAESYAARLTAFDIAADGSLGNRRVWAELAQGAAPDGICIDADGAVWYADVPNQHCVRVAEGGEVAETIKLDRGAFACMLGGPDGRTLFIVAREWRGIGAGTDGPRTGQILSVGGAPAPHAGWP